MIIALLYDIIFMLPLAVSLSMLAKPYFAPDVEMSCITVAAVISSLYLLIIKHVRLRQRLLAVGIAAAFFAAFVFVRKPGMRLNYVIEHKWIMIILVIAVLCLLTRVFINTSPALRIAVASAMFLPLPLSLANRFVLPHACVLMIFMYCITTFADELQRRGHKSGDTSVEKHTVFTFPFLLAVFLTAAIPKIPKEPYDWGFVRKMADSLQNTAAYINRFFTGTGWDGSSPFIGFSDNGRFGGNLTGGSYMVMDITSSAGSDPYLYLAGRRYDTFDGQVWSGDDPGITDAYFDSIETMSAALDCSYESSCDLNDYARSVTVTVNKNRTGTERFFAPSKPVPPTGPASKNSLTYLRFNTGSPEFTALLENGHSIDKDLWDLARGEIGLSDAAFDHAAYERYVSSTAARYLPETTISKRARMYVDKLVNDCSGDYEKLCRIEAALGSGRYSDSPGSLPQTLSDEADYLDYFLFEKQEGYCSYYATAFVLMARYCGIPARMVQGYRVPAGSALHLKVMSDYAHAWAEGYIEGIGWVVFEPTPGMKSVKDPSGWAKAAASSDYYSDHYKQSDTDPSSLSSPKKDTDDLSLPLLRIIIPTVFSILFAMILIVSDILRKKRRYRLSDNRTKALWMCKRCMRFLGKRGFAAMDNETLSEYRFRQSGIIIPEYIDFLTVYERILYSDAAVSAEDVAYLETSYEKLRKAGRKNIVVHNI